MFLSIDDAVFGGQADEMRLVAIANEARERRHRMFVQGGPEFDAFLGRQSAIIVSSWKAVLKESMAAEARSRAKLRFKVANLTASRWEVAVPELTPSDALELMQTPLHLFVEDERSDKGFLYAMANAQLRDELAKAEAERRLCFVHCGGNDQLAGRVRQRVAQGAAAKFTTSVMLDSDAAIPGFPVALASVLMRECEQVGVPIFRLLRRSTENYLPSKALRAWIETRSADRQKTLELAYADHQALSAKAKEHIHMKDGLSADKSLFAENVDALKRYPGLGIGDVRSYLTQHLSNREKLKNTGFGKDLVHAYSEEQLRSQFDQLELTAGRQLVEIDPLIREILSLAK